MKALHLVSYGLSPEHFQLTTIPKPVPKPDHLVIRVKTVALNPVDYISGLGYWKLSPLPVLLGCDVAGVVDTVGSAITKFKPGDEVAGYTGVTSEYGTFAEFALIHESHVIRKPAHLSFEEAATVSVGVMTAVLGLFKDQDLPMPSKVDLGRPKETCVIWGASGSVGTFGVQLAREAGYDVIGVSSPANFDMVKSLGASQVVDRSAPDLVEQIKKHAGGKLKIVLDAVASKETTEMAAQLLEGIPDARYSTVLPPKAPLPANVRVQGLQLGQAGDLGLETEEISALFAANKLKPNQVEKVPGGLNGIPNALAALQKGVSAKKFVAVFDETV